MKLQHMVDDQFSCSLSENSQFVTASQRSTAVENGRFRPDVMTELTFFIEGKGGQLPG